MTTLTMIDMRKNKLTSLDGLDSIAWFEGTSFAFSNNSIASLPATTERLEIINNLDLSHNLLTELPVWVYNIQLNTIKKLNGFEDYFDPRILLPTFHMLFIEANIIMK
jgi:Leucine-rich repeat (LRR) protein